MSPSDAWYRLVIGALVVWRLTHLANAEDGPWQLLVTLRRRAGDGFFGELLDCFYCLSLWLATPIALVLGRAWPERLLLIPALSAAACLLERVTAPPVPHFIEDSEVDHALLRKEPNPRHDDGPDDDGGAGDPAR